MKNLNTISEDLFNKIRGRFPNLTIGDEDGNVITEPSQARFFDFEYKEDGNALGKISISISEENGLSIIYSKDFINDQDQMTQKNWYNFLKELRMFAQKRLLNFDIRDITKTNLTKRDYKFLANRSGDDKMTESKLYGTSRISYQNVGEARIMIKHTESVNQESTTGRTQKIGKIYIESPEGERFKYPYKHLSGARAMARHVAEGGNAYDDFGKHIVGLSEEMAKLRKFKNYMGRSAVMAESLAGYMDIVKERITTVKKTIESLQKPAYYKETFEAFNPPVLEDVPSDIAENWIDELTIKQFNEELQDIFPYIYNLVKEGTKAVELGPDDLVDESALMAYAGKKKHGAEYMKKAAQAGREGASQEELGRLKDKYSKAEKKTKEEFELEQAFEATLGQFSDHVCEECGNPSWTTLGMTAEEIEEGEQHGNSKIYKKCWQGFERVPGTTKGEKGSCRKKPKKESQEDNLEEAYIKTRKDAVEALGRLRGIGKKIETGRDTYDGNLANEYVSDVYDVYSWMDSKLGISGMNDPKLKEVLEPVMQLRGEAKKLETKPGSGENARFGNKIVNTLYPLMVYIQDHMEEPKDENTKEAPESEAGAEVFHDGTTIYPKVGDKVEVFYTSTDENPDNAMGIIVGQGEGRQQWKVKFKDNETGKVVQDTFSSHDEFYILDDDRDNPDRIKDREQGELPMPGGQTNRRNVKNPAGQDEGNAYSGAVAKAKKDGKKKGDKIQGPDGDEITLEKDNKTPLGEFILSYYDRETGQFPKGETAVLTMVEKDYGEQFIEPAKAFIEQVNILFDEYQMQQQPQQLDTEEYDRMRELAGLR